MLAKNPTDSAANLAVGKYYCFLNGDWDKGLPLLARGGDARLKALAAAEFSPATDATTLADGWWDLAERERPPAQPQIRIHAAAWYREAQPNASGLSKVKIDRRLAWVESLPGAKARAARSRPGLRLARGKLLLIFPNDERDVAIAACRKYGLPYDVAGDFDAARDHYRGYSTIVCGSNKMMYWKNHKEPEDFQYINAFIESGGTLWRSGRSTPKSNARRQRHSALWSRRPACQWWPRA